MPSVCSLGSPPRRKQWQAGRLPPELLDLKPGGVKSSSSSSVPAPPPRRLSSGRRRRRLLGPSTLSSLRASLEVAEKSRHQAAAAIIREKLQLHTEAEAAGEEEEDLFEDDEEDVAAAQASWRAGQQPGPGRRE